MEQKLGTKKPDVRYLNEMREVIYDRKWAKSAPNLELYYMYRGLKKKNGLRYDITVIPPRTLGKELVKTKGHQHIGNFGEIYIVLEGEAIYLMQKYGKREVKDTYAVRTKKGEVVAIPPYYGHVTINPSGKTLKMANWLSEKCKSRYDLFEKFRGACYYFTKSGWIKNKNYGSVPKLRFEKPRKTIPKNLDFLKGQ